MTGHILLCAIILMCVEGVRAQKFKLNVYGAHVMDIGVNYELLTGDLNQHVVNHCYQTGGGFEWTIKKQITAELLYLHQNLSAGVSASGNLHAQPINSNLDFVMVSFGDYFLNRFGKLNGFAGIMIGTSAVSSQRTENYAKKGSAKPAAGSRIAINYWFARSIGVKAESLILITKNTTYNAVITRENKSLTASSIYQLTLGAALMFRL